jgi:hypothetical protein
MIRPVKLLLPLLAVAALALGGCASTHRVQIDALAHPALAPAKRTYVFASSGKAGQQPGDLRTDEVLRQVAQALAGRGFRAVAGAEAELNIFVDFGVGDPVTRAYTFTTPIYAEMGGRYSTRTRETKDADGKTRSTVEEVYIPGNYVRVGTDITTNSVTTYRKHLRLSARLREAGVKPEAGREVWTITAVMDDQEGDVRAALPLLTAAIGPHLATDTGRAIVVELDAKGHPAGR